MAQNKGEQGQDRVDTPGLREWKALKATLTPLEFALIRSDCAHSLAAMHNFSDEPGRIAAARRNTILLAIDDADTRSRIATCTPTKPGKGIVTIQDYERYKLPRDPGRRAIYQEFRSWQAAKNEAGIGKVSQPGVALLRSKGERNRKGKGVQWSFEDRVAAVALFRERCSPGARRLPQTQFED